MKWRAIGHSCQGTGHIASGSGCQDAVNFSILPDPDDHDVILVCAGDGAGSAKFAAMAAEFTTSKVVESLTRFAFSGQRIHESDVYRIMEDVFHELSVLAALQETEINEYSTTVLGGMITRTQSVFFQIGDGAIIIGNGNDHFSPLWWPMQGEYQNSTHFLVDDPKMSNLKVMVTDDLVVEFGLITDGLQMLTLNQETKTAHQPFFTDLFRSLRQAKEPEQVTTLQAGLVAFLDSEKLNNRTDDDKTLFLATSV